MDRPYGLLMPTIPDPDLVPFDPPDHPTFRAAFRNIIESYPRALYDEQGLVRYRTRFLDSVLVSEPELIHDILVARAHLFRRDDVARQLCHRCSAQHRCSWRKVRKLKSENCAES